MMRRAVDGARPPGECWCGMDESGGAAQHDGPVARRFWDGDLEVELDLRPQRLRLELGPRVTADREPEAVLPRGALVPAAALAHKAKQVDDRVLAAAKLMMQAGAGRMPGRRYLLARW